MNFIHACYDWCAQAHLFLYITLLLGWKWFLSTIRGLYEARQRRYMHVSQNHLEVERLRIEGMRLQAQGKGKEEGEHDSSVS